MTKVFMSPGIGARDDNGVGNVIANYGIHAPRFGIEFVGPGESYDVELAHAGVKSFDNPAGNNVAMIHGMYWETGEAPPVVYLQSNRNIVESVRQAKVVTVPSNWVAETFRRDMHLSPAIVPHGIDWEEWQDGNRTDHVVLWAKGISNAVCDPRWAVDLARIFPNIRFVSTFGRALENMAVTGPLPRSTMRGVIKNSSIYLSTTEETFGVTTLEAMAAGCPVVGFAWGGNLDIVKTGVSGYLAKPGDIKDLAYGLKYCLENWEELSAGARKEAKEWSWDNATSLMVGAVNRAAEEKTPTFAIVIPCYNKRDTIREAVSSAMAQTIPCEVIVVDDGSSDGSADSVRDLGVKIVSQKNQGVAHARNAGISATEAEFIVCLDGDDSIEPGFLGACYDAIKMDNGIGIAFTSITAHYPDGRSEITRWPDGFDYERQMQQANQVPTCCLFRRSLWERLGGYRQRYAPNGAGAEDAELWLRMGAIGYTAVQATRQGMFHYRIAQGETSKEYSEYPWLSWHPWTRDGIHPFASIAKPLNISHPVRSYAHPEISVIIPVNVGHSPYLVNVLDSLEAQTFRNWEAIVVFDGEVPALPHQKGIVAFLKAYPYAKVYINNENKGAGAARNLGIAASRAPLVYFCDADDWLRPDCLEKHYAAHLSTGKAVYADYYGINPPDRHPRESPVQTSGMDSVVAGTLPDYDCRLAQSQPSSGDPYSWCAVNTLISREDLGNIRFDETLDSLEDWELFIRLARAGVCFHRIREHLWVYNFTTGTRRVIGQVSRDAVIKAIANKEPTMAKKGCGCKDEEESVTVTDLTPGEIKAGYLFAEYRPPTRGKHPVWGVAKPKENYGMRQAGNRFLVKQADVALMGMKFVCGYCGRPFETDVRNQRARCNCAESTAGAGRENVVATATATATVLAPVLAPAAQPVMQVTPQPLPKSVVRDDADKPIPVQQAEPDNFTTISGVGPATAKILFDAGITTFAKLKRMDEAGLRLAKVTPSAIPAILEYING